MTLGIFLAKGKAVMTADVTWNKMDPQQTSLFTHGWELDIFNIKTKSARIGEISLLTI